MKRRDFLAKGGGFLGLSIGGFSGMKEGQVKQEASPDPKKVFLSRIGEIRAEFGKCFNENRWADMEKLYWEDAVLVFMEKNAVYQGRQAIVEFWQKFKAQKPGRMFKSIRPRTDQPPIRNVELIEIMAGGECNTYDMAAVDIWDYELNPQPEMDSCVTSYLHKRICTSGISEQIV
jgi:predicted SnoaL-like aldol condensation-catalyzing enzyme